ncbi:hypothetical protein JYU34_020416, partial [Plutella xylostella]
IPLVDEEPFFGYQILSLPMKDNLSLYHTLLVQNKYVGLTRDRRFYSTFEDLSSCNEYNTDRLICQSMIVHDANAEPICETSILRQENDLYNQHCNIMSTKGEFRVIHRLRKNTWLIIYSDKVNIIEDCGHNFTSTKFQGAGILTLENYCTATIQTTKLKGEGETETKIRIPDLKIDIISEINNHPLIDRVAEVELEHTKYNNIKLDNLDNAANQMKNIKSELERISNQPRRRGTNNRTKLLQITSVPWKKTKPRRRRTS